MYIIDKLLYRRSMFISTLDLVCDRTKIAATDDKSPKHVINVPLYDTHKLHTAELCISKAVFRRYCTESEHYRGTTIRIHLLLLPRLVRSFELVRANGRLYPRG